MTYPSSFCTVIVSPISTLIKSSPTSAARRMSSVIRNEVFDRCGWYLLAGEQNNVSIHGKFRADTSKYGACFACSRMMGDDPLNMRL